MAYFQFPDNLQINFLILEHQLFLDDTYLECTRTVTSLQKVMQQCHDVRCVCFALRLPPGPELGGPDASGIIWLSREDGEGARTVSALLQLFDWYDDYSSTVIYIVLDTVCQNQ